MANFQDRCIACGAIRADELKIAAEQAYPYAGVQIAIAILTVIVLVIRFVG